MTQRTAAAIDAAAAAGRQAALIGYLPVGFPNVDTSYRAMAAVIEAGADIVEVGLPYSDPGMDGPVIQRAVETALAGGVRTADAFGAVEAVAAAGGTPVIMSYWNLVLQYGVDAFARDLANAGGAGIITPDLIPDEAAAWIAAAQEHELDRIFLAAPSSTPERLDRIVNASTGFVYAASTMGVTGTRASVDNHARDLVERLRAAGAPRISVGLGVSNGQQAAEVAEFADGVIVGSALVRALDEAGVDGVAALTADLATGVTG